MSQNEEDEVQAEESLDELIGEAIRKAQTFPSVAEKLLYLRQVRVSVLRQCFNWSEQQKLLFETIHHLLDVCACLFTK